MDKYKQLKINDKPSVLTYAHHAYIHAILENELCIGNELFEFKIENIDNFQWEICTSNVNLEYTDYGTMRVIGSPYAENESCSIMRLCASEDTITVELLKQLYTWAECIFSIVISDTPKLDESNYIKFQHVCSSGIGYKWINEYTNLKRKISFQLPIKMHLKRYNEVLYLYLINDENEFEMVFETILPSELMNKDLYIGVLADAGENQFYNWKYLNYIQLSYDELNGWLSVDYFNQPPKLYSYHNLHNFLEFTIIDLYEIDNVYLDICNFIEWQILMDKYVIIWLDEYYIPNRSSYKKNHYVHPNIVYGFDNNNFDILGYHVTLKKSKVSYDVFRKAYSNEAKNFTIQNIQYKPNNEMLRFDKTYMYNATQSYLKGLDLSTNYSNIISMSKLIYGLDILKILANTTSGNKKLFNDKRISYIIYEHNIIMKERLSFLEAKSFYPHIDYKYLTSQIDDIIEISTLLKNLVLKNTIRNGEEDNIIKKLRQLYEKELNFYTEFCELINPNIQ